MFSSYKLQCYTGKRGRLSPAELNSGARVNRKLLVGGVAAILAAFVGGYHWMKPRSINVPTGNPSFQSGAAPSAAGTRGDVAPIPAVPGSATVQSAPDQPVSTRPATASSATSAPSATTAGSGNGAQESGPQFDIVRTGPDGSAVIAGRATPGATVRIQNGDITLGAVTVGPRGDWVFLPDRPLATGPHELSLTEVIPDAEGKEIATPSSRIVVVIVPEPVPVGSEVVAEGGASGSSAPGGPIAVAVPRDEGGPSTLLQGQSVSGGDGKFQREGAASGPTSGPIAVETLDYDEKGHVALGGRADPGSAVQLYLNNKPVGRTNTDPAGQWRMSPDETVDPGRYTLRADQLGEAGKVTARVELPVQVASDPLVMPEGRRIIVQPGNSLWRIARSTLGEGLHYTEIYQANRAQIRNPDLIYPGQIFTLPDGSKETAVSN